MTRPPRAGRRRRGRPCRRSTTWPWPSNAGPMPGRATPWSSAERGARAGFNVGFGPAQLRFANGARIEILQPWQPEANPFLRRFLDTNGPGPHHLTFKVPDLAAALERRADGRASTRWASTCADPMWKEAFLHPRQATGIVVQLAQAAGEWSAPAPEGFPTTPATPAGRARPRHPRGGRPGCRRSPCSATCSAGPCAGRRRRPDGTWRCVDLALGRPPRPCDCVGTAGGDPTTRRPTTWRAARALHHLAARLAGRPRAASTTCRLSAGANTAADAGPCRPRRCSAGDMGDRRWPTTSAPVLASGAARATGRRPAHV